MEILDELRMVLKELEAVSRIGVLTTETQNRHRNTERVRRETPPCLCGILGFCGVKVFMKPVLGKNGSGCIFPESGQEKNIPGPIFPHFPPSYGAALGEE